MQKLDIDLFNDNELTANQDNIAGATAVPICPPRICGTSILGGTRCTTYAGCNPTDQFADFGF
ncbi:MAG: hypothetical protein QNK37_38120 [Acidobacteriota bacterium]|nr:hypothetical protein [Acidobacteriota bacterium]